VDWSRNTPGAGATVTARDDPFVCEGSPTAKQLCLVRALPNWAGRARPLIVNRPWQERKSNPAALVIVESAG